MVAPRPVVTPCPPDLQRALVAALGAERVAVDEAARREVASDATALWRLFPDRDELPAVPLAVVRPTSTDEVAAAVAIAAERRLPIVPYGGGSGLMGGAVSLQPGIVIDLRAMDRIVRISPEDRTATVQAGVVLKTLHQALEAQGFVLGHDPWSLPVATVGGAISTNGLGYLAGRYGSMGDQVLGLTVVLADGTVLRTRPLPAQAVGPDLTRLFIGAEGTLGVITEATLRIFPRPERRELLAIAFPSFEQGFAAVLDLLTSGLEAAIADYGERFPPPPELGGGRDESDGTPTLYLVVDGTEEEVELHVRRARDLCARHGGRDLGRDEAETFWRHRHDSGERFLEARRAGRRSPWGRPTGNVRYEYLNVVVPASRLLEYRTRCLEVLRQHDVHPLETGFWGWPELFAVLMVKVGRDERDAAETLRRATDEVLMLAQDMGGAMEQCHGVGLRWAHLMERQHGPGLEVLRRIKRALDPHDLMNPAKLGL